MSEKFIFSHDAPRGYGGDTLRTLNNRITLANQPNSLEASAVEHGGVAGNPPYYTHHYGVCVVCCLTQHTPSWCVGGGRYV